MKLRAAAEVGNVKEIARLLQLGADIDAADRVRDVCHERVMLGNRKSCGSLCLQLYQTEVYDTIKFEGTALYVPHSGDFAFFLC